MKSTIIKESPDYKFKKGDLIHTDRYVMIFHSIHDDKIKATTIHAKETQSKELVGSICEWNIAFYNIELFKGKIELEND